METSNITVFSSPPSPQAAAAADIDAVSLGRLSTHLDSLLDPAFFDCTDAEIVLAAGGNDEAGGATVAVHRCILSARSSFFLSHFSSLRAAGEKPRLELAKLVPGGCHISRDALVAVLGYLYTGRLKPPPQEVVVCIDDDCTHESCRPAIDFIVESTYAASGFQISELVSLFQRSLLNFVDTASIEDMVPIIHAAVTCQISGLLDECIQRLAVSSTFNSLYLEKELPGDTYAMIKEIRRITFPDELGYVIVDPQHGKNIRNTHMALDSHDIDLVGMLLKESAVTLDDAFAVHYAATRCTPKVVSELLKLDSANVNLKNNSGYTPLHMACIRLEPGIMVSLIEKGASVLGWTPDGRDALTICKRLTREKDFSRKLEKGQKRSNAYLCVDILEQTKRTCTSDLVTVEETVVTPLLVDNFHMKLIYFENRVAFARLFFPSEAKLAMCIAEADSTEEFTGTTLRKLKEVGLNEIPTMQNRRLRERLDALSKTVELGRRYFPNCSEVLDKFLHEESTDLDFLESGALEDRQVKRMRFYELKEDVRKAFDKDKAASAAVASTASSSSSPRYEGTGKRRLAFRKGSKIG
ncbi:hypothetical protein QOZ80_3BG0267510 [Eleusine coracana subsp. coracana]|nr:hypothetical protein QOZ80_3BG0267510 [Eleusine coracana subsp. coracana]